MTTVETLTRRLNALPQDEREAVAARFLSELEAQEGIPESAQEPLPTVEPVPYARIAHLAGVLKGGPRDLSTNKRYLEGLGERSMR